ncbi:dTDP-4-dehydrorhamnose 3,5-epimerase [Paenibacillus glycanilyticus]|uniref:dTDP-4-dehydrorhamnose 3,5-epimerase n=1 Tax=Paenibacillus glycanilyticus TaxID=126569 RepID=UPI003EBF7FE3
MLFHKTSLEGVYLIEPEPITDNRGFFARAFCRDQFKERGLEENFRQWSISSNIHKGTIRGMHFQNLPFTENKMIQCIQGSVYDVVVDIRKDSKTYKQWEAFRLTGENHRMLYIPPGYAHGFQTLEPHSTLYYHMSGIYDPSVQNGARYDDPAFQIKWVYDNPVISERDDYLAPWNDDYALDL